MNFNYLLDKLGRINPHRGNKKWFKENKPKELSLIEKIIEENNNISFKEALFLYLYNKEKQKCPECGTFSTFKNITDGYNTFCSVKCASRSSITQDKIKKINYIKTGYERPFSNPKIIKKNKEIWKEKYGVDNPMKNKTICQKVKNTTFERYGDYTFNINKKGLEKQSRVWYKKMLKSLEENNLKYEGDYKQYIEDVKTNSYKFTCLKCNHIQEDSVSYNGRGYRCYKCYPYKKSIEEIKIKNYIEQKHDYKIDFNKRTFLDGKELDIYIPEKNLAIEYDGLMYHSFGKHKSSKFNNHNEEKIKKNNHLIKTELCEKKRVNLLHIFENEWLDPVKKDIWKSIISTKLGKNNRVFARKCIIKEVTSKEKNIFLENNHLQGKDLSSIRLGLFYKDELISIMTFGKSRYNKKIDYELIRFVNKKYTSIIGGASKLFKYFKDTYLKYGERVISYANRRHSMGNLYEKLGFTYSHNTNPNFYYFKNNNILGIKGRINYQKHKLRKLLVFFDPKLTETENMYNNNYRKVYDCGNKVYIYKKG